jgi:5-formyltetrahydrofolate cyclo-ligase
MALKKDDLRKRLRQTRLEMLDEEHRLASEAIIRRLKALPNWSATQSLHYFEPIRQLLEPDTSALITYLEDSYPKLKLSTSRLINRNWEVIGVHGDKPPEQFDTVLVPMLGFDPKTLHRIGYGGGYYDRFLATQPQAVKIGVCFERGRVDHIPAEPQDISMDIIITESDVYS